MNSHYRALSLAILTMMMSDCESSDEILGISIVPILTSEVTSSEKHSLYGLTDKELNAIQFAQLNWSNLTADMAKGQGESLNVIADLLSIQAMKKPAFYAMSKNKFTQLIPTFNTTAQQLVFALKVEAVKL